VGFIYSSVILFHQNCYSADVEYDFSFQYSEIIRVSVDWTLLIGLEWCHKVSPAMFCGFLYDLFGNNLVACGTHAFSCSIGLWRIQV
jgi:hypothetical protein